jgi:hypothetical protein
LLREFKEQIPFHSYFELQIAAPMELLSIALPFLSNAFQRRTHVPQATPHENESVPEDRIPGLVSIQTA